MTKVSVLAIILAISVGLTTQQHIDDENKDQHQFNDTNDTQM